MSTPLLIADGDIPTTRILSRIIACAFGDVEVRPSNALFGSDTSNRHVVISRLCHPQFRWLPEYLVRRGRPYAYFIDDNFWELAPEVDPHLALFYGHPYVRRTLDDFVTRASLCIVMSRRLGRYIEARHPAVRTAYLVPGFDINYVAEVARSMPLSTKPATQIRIGYPTSRRTNVTSLLIPVVEALVRQYPHNLQFEFVGWAPEALMRLSNVRLYPHVDDYEAFLALMLSLRWDIAIAPLIGESFETYKTNVKYREYGGCGIAGAYSRVPPYSDYVEDGVTGLLVDNTVDAWVRALRRLIDDGALRQRIVDGAHADIAARLNQRTAELQLRAWLEHLDADGTDAAGAAMLTN